MASFVHHGAWDHRSRQNPALNFIEKYHLLIDNLELRSTPFSSFFAPFAAYHDTKGNTHVTGSHIWAWLSQQCSPFSQIRHDVVEARVVPDEEGRDIVYWECLTHFQLKGDNNEIVVPRFFVWTIGPAPVGEGTDGRQIHKCRVFWDTGVIGRYVTERKREQMRRVKKLEVRKKR
ncbi:Uncharacterized protein BP5553_03476 [Venustampulla echinocandica]|uniref:SnoaL-like domain-containing protein n=1 Tax=Venustampulla echinocandica TaxID=2656787 RepID=A0A370TUD8_9HELO|nr:Uncharacterized protein BP5553_03476 [Venustampulla echinocandica]RDL39136.1 Uncharacterized protein BP5553_03476 [Venustampulla echinocandica]